MYLRLKQALDSALHHATEWDVHDSDTPSLFWVEVVSKVDEAGHHLFWTEKTVANDDPPHPALQDFLHEVLGYLGVL